MKRDLEGLVNVILDFAVKDKSFSEDFLDSYKDLIKHIVTKCPEHLNYFYDDLFESLVTSSYQHFNNENDLFVFNNVMKKTFDYWNETEFDDSNYTFVLIQNIFTKLEYDPSQLQNLNNLFNNYKESPLLGVFCNNLNSNLDSVHSLFNRRFCGLGIGTPEFKIKVNKSLNAYLNNLSEFYSQDNMKLVFNKQDYLEGKNFNKKTFEVNLNHFFNEISSSFITPIELKDKLIKDIFEILGSCKKGSTIASTLNNFNGALNDKGKWAVKNLLNYKDKLLDKEVYDETISYLMGQIDGNRIRTEGQFRLEIQKILVNPNLNYIDLDDFTYYQQNIAPYLVDSDFKNNLSMSNIKNICDAYQMCDSYVRSSVPSGANLSFNKIYRKFKFTYFDNLNEAIFLGDTPEQKIDCAIIWSRNLMGMVKDTNSNLYDFIVRGKKLEVRG